MIHKTKRIKVWVDVDEGIVDIVEHLQSIDGITTHTSCQGTIGEGGPNQYKGYVHVSWSTPEAFKYLQDTFDITHIHYDQHHCYIYRNGKFGGRQ